MTESADKAALWSGFKCKIQRELPHYDYAMQTFLLVLQFARFMIYDELPVTGMFIRATRHDVQVSSRDCNGRKQTESHAHLIHPLFAHKTCTLTMTESADKAALWSGFKIKIQIELPHYEYQHRSKQVKN